MTKVNLNENKNQTEISDEKKKELKILKVLNVIIGEKETLYNCIMDDGKIEAISASLINN